MNGKIIKYQQQPRSLNCIAEDLLVNEKDNLSFENTKVKELNDLIKILQNIDFNVGEKKVSW